MEANIKESWDVETIDGLILPPKEGQKEITAGEMNPVGAMDIIQEKAKNSKLSEVFYRNARKEIEYLCHRTGLSRFQVVVISVLGEMGESSSWRELGRYFGFSRLRMMTYEKEMDELVCKGWVYKCGARERCGMFEGFHLTRGLLTAFRENRTFEPERLDGFDTQRFVERMVSYLGNEGQESYRSCKEHAKWIMRLAELNRTLPIARAILDIADQREAMVFVLAVSSYAQFADTDNEPIHSSEISDWFDEEYEDKAVQMKLRRGETELQKEEYLEYSCDCGMIDTGSYVLTKEIKQRVLSDFQPLCVHRRKSTRDIISCTTLKEKELFFNQDTRAQVDRLGLLLEESTLSEVMTRLETNGMRKGIACLFYGSPGTGKTETVFQLALKTGRDIMQVNIAGIRDKYVGESEKNIKQLFNRYREICKHSERTPILLFNEADAVIGTRFESMRSSVERMDNAIQNIILQEMENFDGILIATTNLTGNLDRAFDRRFLFKVEFTRPDLKTRQKIWQSAFPQVESGIINRLSREFDFSGGQIENISRKYQIETILGEIIDGDKLELMCREENLKRGDKIRVGFN